MTKSARTTVPFENPEDSLGYLCRIAFRAFSRSLERSTIPHGVTMGQWRFLRVLWVADGISQRELSQRVGMREPTTVTALKSLERSKFVRRIPDPKDRRMMRVYLTPLAHQLKEKLIPCVASVNKVATEGLTAGEIKQLHHMLKLVIENLAPET